MTIPLSGDSGPAPVDAHPAFANERDKSDRKVIIIVISLLIVVVVGLVAVVGGLSFYYASKYTAIEKTHDSMSWDPDQSEAASTTFESPAAGVSLKLPGKWELSKTPTNYLCRLVNADHFSAALEVDFPALTPSVDGVAARVATHFETISHWTLIRDESLQVNGLPAHLLRMNSQRNVDVDIVLVKKWPVNYDLTIAGRPDATDEWQRIEDALPQAITIK
jgi:hypothetical protein